MSVEDEDGYDGKIMEDEDMFMPLFGRHQEFKIFLGTTMQIFASNKFGWAPELILFSPFSIFSLL